MCVIFIVFEVQSFSVTDFTTVTIISRTSLIAADVVVIISTWLATYNTVIKSRRVLNGDGKSLSRLLLRDGTMYFM